MGYRTTKSLLVASMSLGLAACFLQPVTKTDQSPESSQPSPRAATTSKAPRPTSASKPEPLHVAVLDPENFTEAMNRHRQSLATRDKYSIIGGDFGYYMDIQEAGLRQQIGDGGITIKREGNNIVLSVPGGAMFGSNSFFLRDNVQQLLAPIATVLAEYDKTQVSIYGHTDDVGEDAYNQQLSEKRAISVAQFLVDAGVARQRIVIIGYGELLPLTTNQTPEGREQNRRVELQLIPIAQ